MPVILVDAQHRVLYNLSPTNGGQGASIAMTKGVEPSIIKGPPVEDEPGIGPLTLSGFIKDVTERFSDREALVLREDGEDIRWSYNDLWERSVEVARALIAAG